MHSWKKRCLGESLEPSVRCMGSANVALAVKGLARCLKDMTERKGALRIFACYPEPWRTSCFFLRICFIWIRHNDFKLVIPSQILVQCCEHWVFGGGATSTQEMIKEKLQKSGDEVVITQIRLEGRPRG